MNPTPIRSSPVPPTIRRQLHVPAWVLHLAIAAAAVALLAIVAALAVDFAAAHGTALLCAQPRHADTQLARMYCSGGTFDTWTTAALDTAAGVAAALLLALAAFAAYILLRILAPGANRGTAGAVQSADACTGQPAGA